MLEQLVIAFQIILIDIVMAADNAIIIGLIASGFAPDNRRKIIAWGVAGAFVFRIFLHIFLARLCAFSLRASTSTSLLMPLNAGADRCSDRSAKLYWNSLEEQTWPKVK